MTALEEVDVAGLVVGMTVQEVHKIVLVEVHMTAVVYRSVELLARRTIHDYCRCDDGDDDDDVLDVKALVEDHIQLELQVDHIAQVLRTPCAVVEVAEECLVEAADILRQPVGHIWVQAIEQLAQEEGMNGPKPLHVDRLLVVIC